MLPTSEGTLGTSRTPDEVVVKTPAAVLVCEGEKLTLKGNPDSGAVIGGEKLIDDKLEGNGIGLYDLLSVVKKEPNEPAPAQDDDNLVMYDEEVEV